MTADQIDIQIHVQPNQRKKCKTSTQGLGFTTLLIISYLSG